MYKSILTVLILMAAVFTGYSQTKKSDVEQAIKALEDKIYKYEAAEGSIMMKMTEIDTKLEKKLGVLLKHLVAARDSRETGFQVIRNKKKIIRDLQSAQKSYNQARENVDKVFKTNTKHVGHDIYTLKKMMDDKINQRIKQITKVTDSLAGYKEHYDRYNHYNDRRNVQTADREKNRVIKDFEEEIETLEKKAEKIDDGFSNEGSRERLINTYSEMQAINERVNLLEHSIEDILNGGKDGKKIGNVAGLRLDKEVRKSSAEINGYLKSFFYALSAYQRTLAQRKDFTARVVNLKKAISK